MNERIERKIAQRFVAGSLCHFPRVRKEEMCQRRQLADNLACIAIGMIVIVRSSERAEKGARSLAAPSPPGGSETKL